MPLIPNAFARLRRCHSCCASTALAAPERREAASEEERKGREREATVAGAVARGVMRSV